jgi:hypothetical protein
MRRVESQPAAVAVTGPWYLQLATLLLQRMRVASPVGGIWEAADVQWWSRQERAADRHGPLFWLDGRGEPLAAVILTDFGRSVQCDVLVLRDDLERTVWRVATRRADAIGAAAEIPVRPDNAVGVAELTAAGWRPTAEPGVVSSWLEAGRRPRIPPLVPGYRLLSRADGPGRPHPMIARNGARVEQRLRSACPELPAASRPGTTAPAVPAPITTVSTAVGKRVAWLTQTLAARRQARRGATPRPTSGPDGPRQGGASPSPGRAKPISPSYDSRAAGAARTRQASCTARRARSAADSTSAETSASVPGWSAAILPCRASRMSSGVASCRTPSTSYHVTRAVTGHRRELMHKLTAWAALPSLPRRT